MSSVVPRVNLSVAVRGEKGFTHVAGYTAYTWFVYPGDTPRDASTFFGHYEFLKKNPRTQEYDTYVEKRRPAPRTPDLTLERIGEAVPWFGREGMPNELGFNSPILAIQEAIRDEIADAFGDDPATQAAVKESVFFIQKGNKANNNRHALYIYIRDFPDTFGMVSDMQALVREQIKTMFVNKLTVRSEEVQKL